jgi:hypothetical protein
MPAIPYGFTLHILPTHRVGAVTGKALPCSAGDGLPQPAAPDPD